LKCELCGRNITGKIHTVEIEGAILRVCDKCSKLGKSVTYEKKPVIARTGFNFGVKGEGLDELYIREDYYKVIKEARERLGLTQEELGRKLGEKSSVISKLETGKLKPSIPLARKIEHVLKVKIIEEEEGI